MLNFNTPVGFEDIHHYIGWKQMNNQFADSLFNPYAWEEESYEEGVLNVD